MCPAGASAPSLSRVRGWTAWPPSTGPFCAWGSLGDRPSIWHPLRAQLGIEGISLHRPPASTSWNPVSFAVVVERDEWLCGPPLQPDGRVTVGIPVWSLPVDVEGHTGEVEGRTTGGRRTCPARSCGGWQVGVRWETGQLMYLCSRGWRYDAASNTMRMTAGTALSTTTASDRANTRADPAPRSKWPDRDALGPAWKA